MSFSKKYFFSLVLGSPGGPDMVKGKYYPKMYCSMAIAASSIFGAKLKIVLTGVHSRVRESLANRLIYFNSVLFVETYLFPCKKCLLTI